MATREITNRKPQQYTQLDLEPELISLPEEDGRTARTLRRQAANPVGAKSVALSLDCDRLCGLHRYCLSDSRALHHHDTSDAA